MKLIVNRRKIGVFMYKIVYKSTATGEFHDTQMPQLMGKFTCPSDGQILIDEYIPSKYRNYYDVVHVGENSVQFKIEYNDPVKGWRDTTNKYLQGEFSSKEEAERTINRNTLLPDMCRNTLLPDIYRAVDMNSPEDKEQYRLLSDTGQSFSKAYQGLYTLDRATELAHQKLKEDSTVVVQIAQMIRVVKNKMEVVQEDL